MDQYHNLVTSRNSKDATKKKVDVIGDQKRVEKEVRELLKQQKADALKNRKQDEMLRKDTIKSERQFSGATGKLAREELRKLDKKAAKEGEELSLCEHGINKCRICNPHTGRKDDRRH